MTGWFEVGRMTAMECGYEHPSREEIEYFARIEANRVARARRGIPISAP